jgi:TrmH family RNA methyltransferase
VVLLPDAFFGEISTLESPADIGFVMPLPAPAQPDATRDAVVLDRLQDAGNVGSILRSASALGVPQVLALKGTAALWSPKVLRAGMGAHFGLRLVEGLEVDDVLAGAGVPLVGTSSHARAALPQATLPRPCGLGLRARRAGRVAAPGGACTSRCAFRSRAARSR